MGNTGIVAIVFEGGPVYGHIETWFAGIREEMALSLCRRLGSVGHFSRVFLATDRPGLASRAWDQGTQHVMTETAREFHFGDCLKRVAHLSHANSFVYMSGGSGQLMSDKEIGMFAELVESNPGSVVANNLYSADMFGLHHADLPALAVPRVDNSVPFALMNDAGMNGIALPDSVGVQFDVDTPMDALILALVPGVECTIRDAIHTPCPGVDLSAAVDRLGRLRLALRADLAEISLIGRVSPLTVLSLNKDTRWRVRVFSEERGMRSLDRDRPGGPRSLMARVMETLGFGEFFSLLDGVVQGALIDSRVALACLGCSLDTEDRFKSDLFIAEAIEDGRAREFTARARDAEIPVLLGGHSLVNGAVRALALCQHGCGDII